jgi:hypothetical protein
MAKSITARQFNDVLLHSRYAVIKGAEGIFELVDNYSTEDYDESAWALIHIEDEYDVIILSNYLDNPNVSIEYTVERGLYVFTLDSGYGEPLDIIFMNPIKF